MHTMCYMKRFKLYTVNTHRTKNIIQNNIYKVLLKVPFPKGMCTHLLSWTVSAVECTGGRGGAEKGAWHWGEEAGLGMRASMRWWMRGYCWNLVGREQGCDPVEKQAHAHNMYSENHPRTCHTYATTFLFIVKIIKGWFHRHRLSLVLD